MNINQLKYFVSVAEMQSFSQAAKENYITQTAITQQVQQLEEYLDTTLIDRSVRPVRLTPAGTVFYQEAREILSRMEFAVHHTRIASGGGFGNINVGYTKGYERSELSVMLRQFHQQNPGVFLNCERNSSDSLSARLLGNELDIIFTWDSTGLLADPRVESLLVEKVPLVGVFYASHPLARKTKISRKDLKGETILYMSPSAESNSHGDSYFLYLYQKAGFVPDIRIYTSDAESVLMMVSAEEGVSILPSYYTSKLEHVDNLVFVPLEGEEEVENIHAFRLRENQNPLLEDFWLTLKQFVV